MKLSTKFLLTLTVLGISYSFYRLFTGQGGGGLGDSLDTLALSSIVLFISSLLIILVNLKQIKKHIDTFAFLLLGLPLTILVVQNIIEVDLYNRTPDLVPKYQRPISSEVFIEDSIKIKMQIDSLIALKNRNTGGTKITDAFIDTIIYSQTGNQVFVSYIQKYAPNDLGNNLDPAYLSANKRENGYWNVEEGTPTRVTFGGSFLDITTVKKEVRKFYFNQYSFIDADSLKKNFFWKRNTKVTPF